MDSSQIPALQPGQSIVVVVLVNVDVVGRPSSRRGADD